MSSTGPPRLSDDRAAPDSAPEDLLTVAVPPPISPWAVLLALPLWLYAFVVLALTLCVDALAWPFVAWARRRVPADQPVRATPSSSILILNWNGVDFLRQLLPSVLHTVERTPGEHEIIVIDNGSTDESRALVARDNPAVRLVEVPENRFFIRGNRAGAETVGIDTDVLVFLNNDMVVEPDFLPALLARFGAADLFAVTARIEMDGTRVETGRTRAFYKRGALRQEQLPLPAEPSVEPALWAGGGSSAFDHAKYRALGGFEDLYEPCYAEDLSLSYAAWKRGWRVEFTPEAGVHHAHRGTSERVFGRRQVERLDRRNRELFFWRSITDLRWLVSHTFHLPWNTAKDARWNDLGLQYGALLATIPRLPQALCARQRSRAARRRRDADVLALSSAQPSP